MLFQTPTGMRDLLDEELRYFQRIERVCRRTAAFYGFERIEPPILEPTELFRKGTGQGTDIVEKEMFSLTTKGGTRLTLRPELTPSIVRAYIQHGMRVKPKPVRLWYFSPVFRHERPQKGRYRQFYQCGFESLGVADPVVDAFIIQLCCAILKELQVENYIVEINSLGCQECRPSYQRDLVRYLSAHRASLCSDCKRRLNQNPLRVLDCKQEKCQRIVVAAPQSLDYLCKKCHNHFKEVLEFLDELDIPYHLDPCLVRGLDYYTRTVFEVYEDTDKGREQGALAGGGRYDELVKRLGGKERTPACGVAFGVERVVNAIRKAGRRPRQQAQPSIFLAQVGKLAKYKALKLLEQFRKQNIRVAEALHKDSLSGQLKIANSMGVEWVLILAQKEALNNQVIIKTMRTGEQKIVGLDKVVDEMKKRIL